MIVYLVVVDDRHVGPSYTLFLSKEAALKKANDRIDGYRKYYNKKGISVNISDNPYAKHPSILWVNTSREGDYVEVIEMDVQQ